jgi:hypothetical protein
MGPSTIRRPGPSWVAATSVDGGVGLDAGCWRLVVTLLVGSLRRYVALFRYAHVKTRSDRV